MEHLTLGSGKVIIGGSRFDSTGERVLTFLETDVEHEIGEQMTPEEVDEDHGNHYDNSSVRLQFQNIESLRVLLNQAQTMESLWAEEIRLTDLSYPDLPVGWEYVGIAKNRYCGDPEFVYSEVPATDGARIFSPELGSWVKYKLHRYDKSGIVHVAKRSN